MASDDPLLNAFDRATVQEWQQERDPIKRLSMLIKSPDTPAPASTNLPPEHTQRLEQIRRATTVIADALTGDVRTTGWLDNHDFARVRAIRRGFPVEIRSTSYDRGFPGYQEDQSLEVKRPINDPDSSDDSSSGDDDSSNDDSSDDDSSDDDDSSSDDGDSSHKSRGSVDHDRPQTSHEAQPVVDETTAQSVDDHRPQTSHEAQRGTGETAAQSAVPNTSAATAAPPQRDQGSVQWQMLKAMYSIVEEGLHELAREQDVRSGHYYAGDTAMNVELKPHQRDGVGRLMELEQAHGAWILADEMGLGKTIQTLTLMANEAAKDAKEGLPIKTNLIVVPPVLIRQWKRELRNRAPILKFMEYHKNEHEHRTMADFAQHHVVLTTYHRVAKEYKEHDDACEDWQDVAYGYSQKLVGKGSSQKLKDLQQHRVTGALQAFEWYRIVLDEGHRIRTQEINATNGCKKLRGQFKGVITGTPIQNDYKDFLSLFQFMDIFPLNDEGFFHSCFTKKGKDKGRASEQLTQFWEAIFALIRKRLCVRRVKGQMFEGHRVAEIGAKEITEDAFRLEREAQEIQDEFSFLWDPAEREARKKAKRDGDPSYVEYDRGEILAAISRLHLACIHPILTRAKYGEPGEDEMGPSETDLRATTSGRDGDLHQEAIERLREKPKASKRSSISDETISRRKQFKIELAKDEQWKSEKIERGIAEVEKMLKAHQAIVDSKPAAERPEAMGYGKVIVFAPYVCGLDAFAAGLDSRGIKYYEFHGLCSDKDREETLRKFEEKREDGKAKDLRPGGDQPDPVRVMLVSIRTAAEGLDLFHASNILMLTRVWNPAVELQAIARADRIGQKYSVKVVYIDALKSLEQRIKDVQRDKNLKVRGIMTDHVFVFNAVKQALDELTFDNFVARVANRATEPDDDRDGDSDSDSDSDDELVNGG